jgi:hypothetical protein
MFAIALALMLSSEAGAAQAAPDPHDDVTVTGDNRIVCRRVSRTATRMRVGRICRPLSEWRGGTSPRAQEDPNATIDGASDTLDAFGADDASTNDQRCPLETARTHDTTLGPRQEK